MFGSAHQAQPALVITGTFRPWTRGSKQVNAQAEVSQKGLDSGLDCLPVQQGSVEQLAGGSVGIDANGGGGHD